MTASKMTGEEKEIVLAVAQLAAEIAARTTKGMSRWEKSDHAEDLEMGPIYSPAFWFNDGISLPEKNRVRFLRAVQRLHHARVIIGTARNGRLWRLRLSPAGAKLAAELAAADDEERPTDPEPAAG